MVDQLVSNDQPLPATTQSAPVINIANALTLLRIFLVPVFAIALLHNNGQNSLWRWWACAIFSLAIATDRADGQIARRRQLVTNVGRLADPIADKALIGAALIGLSILAELPWWITITILVREIAITLLRFSFIRYGIIAANRGGKAKTTVQAIAIVLLVAPFSGLIHDIALAVMLVAVILTVLTGCDYVHQAFHRRTRSEEMAAPVAADR